MVPFRPRRDAERGVDLGLPVRTRKIQVRRACALFRKGGGVVYGRTAARGGRRRMAAFTLFCAVASLGLATILWLGLRAAPGPLAVATAAAGFVAAVYAANPVHQVYSFHGLWQASIVYAILGGGAPPETPIFAGERLLYPWGHHLLLAAFSRTLAILPATAASLVNVACAFAAVLLLARIGRRLGFDRAAIVAAVALALFGITFTNVGPIGFALQWWIPFRIEPRGTPPIGQFTHFTPSPLVIVAFLAMIDGLLAVGESSGRARSRGHAQIGLAVVAAGFFYPVQLPAVGVSTLAGAAALAAAPDRRRWREAGTVAAILAIAALALLPYLYAIGHGKQALARPGIAGSAALAGNLGRHLVTVLPIAVLALSGRRAWRPLAAAAPLAWRIVAAVALASGAAHLFVDAPDGVQYKALILHSVTLGILAAPVLAALGARRPLIAFLLLWSFQLPASGDLFLKLADEWRVPDPFRRESASLVHADARDEALYRWIREESPPDAVFVDDFLTIPAFGRRPLFVGLDLRRDRIRGPRPRDGWGTKPVVLLRVAVGHPDAAIYHRTMAALDLLAEDRDAVSAETLERVAALGRPVYLVARSSALRAVRAGDPAGFAVAFEGDAATVFRVPSPAARVR